MSWMYMDGVTGSGTAWRAPHNGKNLLDIHDSMHARRGALPCARLCLCAWWRVADQFSDMRRVCAVE